MDAVRYALRFPEPAAHLVEVEAEYPTGGVDSVELMMAAWTPGSYLVRDYAGRVEALESADGFPLRKTRKNRWKVQAQGAATVRVRYRVYCREMTVRSNWVERDFAILNGAPTFLTVVDPRTDRPAALEHRVRLEPPPNWPTVHSAMNREGEEWVAGGFDELVDSPIVAGDLAVDGFEAGGVSHHLVHVGDWSLFDRDRAQADVKTLTEAQQSFWGEVPYGSYSFFNALTETRGGLEHLNSMLIMASRWATRTRKAYFAWLKLVSHEFFHAWNVKRLRPAALGPFDYERENHSRSLWVAEGATSYYEALLLRRAGLATDEEFFEALSEDVKALQTTPGRLADPLTESSFDAWIKLYKKHEGSANSTISYYVKGAVVCFLLDAEIRRSSADGKSLDDVMRAAWAKFSGERGFEEEEFRSVISGVAGKDPTAWLAGALDRVEELDYAPALEFFGLRFKAAEEPKTKKAWLGAEWESREGRAVVTVVKRGTPAQAAGVQAEDELVAIDELRVGPEDLEERLEQYGAGDRVELVVSRRGRLLRVPVELTEEPGETWQLEADPGASGEAVERRKRWLSGPGGA